MINPYNIDTFTLLTLVGVSLVYALITWLTAVRLGSNFDERYKVVTAMAAAYLVVIGGWRYLDARSREADKDAFAMSEAICRESLAAAGELTQDYQAAVGARPVQDRDVAASAASFQKQYAQAFMGGEVGHALDDFNSVAQVDNWGRNINHQTPGINAADWLGKLSFRATCLEKETESLAKACNDMMRSAEAISLLPRPYRSNVGPSQPRDPCFSD